MTNNKKTTCRVESAKTHLMYLMECVYKTGDMSGIEMALGELCEDLDVNVDIGTPVIEKIERMTYAKWFQIGMGTN